MRKFLALCMSAALVLPGCVEVDNSLGEGLVDNRLLYKTAGNSSLRKSR